MQIAPLNAMGMNSSMAPNNTTYDSAQTAAESAKFAEMLRDVQRKADTAAQADHVVNEAAMSQRDKELKEACKGFEAMFLSMMYKQMRATVPENKLFGESNGQKIFMDMRDNELMKTVADSGGLGLADLMYRQLSPQVNGPAEGQKK